MHLKSLTANEVVFWQPSSSKLGGRGRIYFYPPPPITHLFALLRDKFYGHTRKLLLPNNRQRGPLALSVWVIDNNTTIAEE